MGRLSEILHGSGGGGDFTSIWNSTTAAGDFGPLPSGEYECDVTRGQLESSRTKGTPGYQIEFTVRDGEHKSRKVWHDCWLTPAALPQTKRDLLKLGITSPEQMERLLPRGIICKVKVALRRDDDGTERNRVQRFDVLRVETPEPDPFAPTVESDEVVDPFPIDE